MRSFAVALLAAGVLASPAFAFPHIAVTASETLSNDPLRVRTTFTVQLVGYEPGGYDGFSSFQ